MSSVASPQCASLNKRTFEQENKYITTRGKAGLGLTLPNKFPDEAADSKVRASLPELTMCALLSNEAKCFQLLSGDAESTAQH